MKMMTNLVYTPYPTIFPTYIPKEQETITLVWPSPKKKIALITGITGQDGSYLAEWLLHNDYMVYGIVRRASTNNLERIRHILDKINLIEGDITDSVFIYQIIEKIKPNEIYNLAAQSHVQTSFSNPDYTYRVNTLGLLNILNSVKELDRTIRIYQASTSEMFGNVPAPQGIDSDFEPASPYACSKLAAHDLTRFYTNIYNMFVVSGILFNHESPRRGENFVTRKITKYFGNSTFENKLRLGNIDTTRDWGFAPDYVKVMWSSLQVDHPMSFVLGTGIALKISEFLNLVGLYIGINWHEHVRVDTSENIRDQDVFHLRAKSDFKVQTDVNMLVKIMMDYDVGLPDEFNDYVPGEGIDYYMEHYGKIFAWRI